jgi:hypothetical protein
MHRRLLIRSAAAAMLVALATPLSVDRSVTPLSVDRIAPDAATAAVGAPPATPEAGTRAARPTQVAEAAPDGSAAVACEPERPAEAAAPTSPDDPGEQLAQLERAAATLAQSSDPEHLLALAVLRRRDEPAGSLELMSRARALDPDNPLIALDLAELCLGQPQAPECAGGDPEREVLRLAGGNGAVWARVAAWRYQRGDRDGALEAIRRAAVAPAFDEYWIEHTLLFERALAASTAYTYAERVAVAFGLPNPGFERAIEIINSCRDEGASSAEWRRACADLGARMEADADVVLGTAIGLHLQRIAFEAAGDEPAAERVRQRTQEVHDLVRDAGPSDILLHGDPAALSELMAELGTYGELAAFRYLKETMDRRAAGTASGCPENP